MPSPVVNVQSGNDAAQCQETVRRVEGDLHDRRRWRRRRRYEIALPPTDSRMSASIIFIDTTAPPGTVLIGRIIDRVDRDRDRVVVRSAARR